MNDYERKGCDKYGADMGRNSTLDRKTTAKLSLRRVPINSGGYDPGGAYWGTGQALWCFSDLESGEVCYLRACDRRFAKAAFPNAKFFR